MEENIILTKTYSFALRIIKLYKYLNEEKKEYTLSRQILRSGTSIGANSEEATGSISKKEFRSKYFISYKEARETHYWLRLLKDSDYIEAKLADSLIADVEEILKILGAILKTLSKKN
ncbi:MAG: four helix bundle protein [Bacteroidota bacterium]|nr:four helix bundle protein [Bacteroidota bacterium]